MVTRFQKDVLVASAGEEGGPEEGAQEPSHETADTIPQIPSNTAAENTMPQIVID